ncbi:hypothetical protein [Paenibacillus sp. UNC451MF]|nr:hypothetical protein [Paenibacillus sp. UNC451MF]
MDVNQMKDVAAIIFYTAGAIKLIIEIQKMRKKKKRLKKRRSRK